MLNKSKTTATKSPPQYHDYDWLKVSRISCPSCRSNYVMPVKRAWYQKLLHRQKKFWCQDCGHLFWRND